jgi:hypothetical protein
MNNLHVRSRTAPKDYVNHKRQNILVFELGYAGHYASYIQHLASYW